MENAMDYELQDRVAVVTGASRGIGLAIARLLAAEGARVVGAARTITPELRDVSAVALDADLATPEGPPAVIEHALAEFGGVDVLVNNVGAFHARTGGFAAVSDGDWHTTLEINVLSAVRAIRAALPSLVEREGSIINVSSINARMPQPAVVDYAAAKAALTNLGKALAEELAAQGVRVNTVSPGPTRTPAWEAEAGFGASLAEASGTTLQDFLGELPAHAGLSTGRLTEPEEVAAVVLLLASRKARNVSGADYVVDGGQAKTV
jgi:putative oxidoreductase